jgi:flagellar biosynthesis anti-sigma factor FlgM
MKVDSNLSNPWLESIGRSTTDSVPANSKSIDAKQTSPEFPDDTLSIRNAPGGDIRADKVEALQSAIANGTYDVSAESIADAIVREWQG